MSQGPVWEYFNPTDTEMVTNKPKQRNDRSTVMVTLHEAMKQPQAQKEVHPSPPRQLKP